MKRRVLSILLAALMLSSAFVFTSLAATLVWPVPGHTNLSQGFHDGAAIDISDGSIAGATVVAAMGGSVTNVFTCGQQHYGSMGDCSGFGTGVVILGDDNRYYQYAHMQANSIPSNVYVGARVNAGQMIGRVGTTGNSSGNHLHFGISTGYWWNQSGINPQYETYTYAGWNNPEGCLDICQGGAGVVFVRGWAFDRDNMESDINIHVYIGGDSWVDGAEGHSIWANKERSDVNSVYGCGNYHGFDENISTNKIGLQEVYVFAINIGSGETVLLDHKTVTITQHIHSYASKVTKAATCSATGVRTYTCSCGDSYTETIAKNSSNHVNTKSVAASSSTCIVKGYTAGVYCNDCKKYISGHAEQPLAPHKTELRNQKDATYDTEGYTGDEYCTVCKQTIKTGTVIEKLEKPTQPGEQDQTNTSYCRWCGKQHNGFFGVLTMFFHTILVFIAGARY